MFEPRGTRNGQKFNFGEAEVESFLFCFNSSLGGELLAKQTSNLNTFRFRHGILIQVVVQANICHLAVVVLTILISARPESLRRPKRLSSPAPDLIPERPGTYPRKISRRSLPPPPPPPRSSSLYSLSSLHASSSLSTRSPSTSSVASSFTSILSIRPSQSSVNLSPRPSVLSPIDVDCEVFSSPAIQLRGEDPPTVLSPVDVDSAVEQLASSVRRISEEQDALFNIFRSGHITGSGGQKRSRSIGNDRKEEEDMDQVGAEKGRMEEVGKLSLDEKQGQPNVTENLELVNARRESDEYVKDTTNLKSNEETQLPKKSAKPKSEDKSEEKKKKEKDEKKTKKRRPSLFVEIPPVEADLLKVDNNDGREHAQKEASWSVSIPIIRTDRQDGVTKNPVKERESKDNQMKRNESNNKPAMTTSINIPILRSVEPEEKGELLKKSRVVVDSKESGRCTNDDGARHNCFPPATNEDALVSHEMRSVISKLRRVKGELEKKGVEEKANGGNAERIVADTLDNEITNEPWSDTDGEDYIEATGPTPDLETARDIKEADPMSPLVSQIVEIRQFIKKFRRSLADEETFLNSNPNTVSKNSETVEATEKKLTIEKPSPQRLKRNWSLREGNLVDWNGRNQEQDGRNQDQDGRRRDQDRKSQDQDRDGRGQDQDQDGRSQDRDGRSQDQDQRDEDDDQISKGGLFWASPALVKEEVEKTEWEELMTDAGSNEDGKEDGRSSYLILPSSPNVASPVISSRKKKVSVTSFTTKKVSVTSPDWNSDNHHTFVHLI